MEFAAGMFLSLRVCSLPVEPDKDTVTLRDCHLASTRGTQAGCSMPPLPLAWHDAVLTCYLWHCPVYHLCALAPVVFPSRVPSSPLIAHLSKQNPPQMPPPRAPLPDSCPSLSPHSQNLVADTRSFHVPLVPSAPPRGPWYLPPIFWVLLS